MRLPPAGAAFDYQLGGDAPLPAGVTVVARDWEGGTPPGGGVYAICYVNAFQSQPEVEWPAEVVTEFEDPAWPGEFVIDLSTAASRGRALQRAREMIETCAAKRFDAVEFDNLDTFSRFEDLPFGQAETVRYATALVNAAHDTGLAAGQKNTAELLGAPIGFDFAVVEQCGEYDECAAFQQAYGDQVLAIEYTAEGLATACAVLGPNASVVLRDLGLSTPLDPGYVYSTCPSALADSATSGA
ncbi:MAG: endo alpha-1,4 polygalactosaminidase [Actinomycetota bacterium]|nr:endo alpha-1,4 polygalactosaminidase [Actinomycetota bacterium]